LNILGNLLQRAAEVDAIFRYRRVGDLEISTDNEFKGVRVSAGFCDHRLQRSKHWSDSGQGNSDGKPAIRFASRSLHCRRRIGCHINRRVRLLDGLKSEIRLVHPKLEASNFYRISRPNGLQRADRLVSEPAAILP